MANNPVVWFEIYVQDLERAQKFYETVLQTQLSKIGGGEPEMLGFPSGMEGYGSSGALVKMEGFSSGGNSVLVYFGCDDCSVEGNRVVEAGGRIQREKISIGEYGFIVLAYDTEGNMFGLHSMQ